MDPSHISKVLYWRQDVKNLFSSDAQSCPTLCNPMNSSTPGLPVHQQLPEFTQTHVHRVSVVIQPSHLCCSLLFLTPISPTPLPASGSFPVSQLFAWGGQSVGASASASVFPMNIQGWFPLELITQFTQWLTSFQSCFNYPTHFFFSLECRGEGNGNPLQYSRLENPMDGGAW